MKRKSRKSMPSEATEDDNDSSAVEQNGNKALEEPEDKKRKSVKKRSNKATVPEEKESQSEASEEPEDNKRKSGKKRSSKATVPEEKESQYEVEAVIDEKNVRGVRHYLIRWKGYEPESDTWEPESTLSCDELITEFKAKQKKKGKSKSRNSKNGNDEKWNETENFEVDRILEVYFKKNGQREFLVSWRGYPPSQNSWEPEENMNCPDLIEKFMEKVERAKETDQRELRVNRAHTDRFTLSMGAKGRRLSKRNQTKQRIHYYDAE